MLQQHMKGPSWTQYLFEGNVILSLFRDPFSIEPPESGTH